MRFRGFLVEHMGFDDKKLKKSDIEAQWAELQKLQAQCRHDFLSGGGRRPRKINLVLLQSAYPGYVDDELATVRKAHALGDLASEHIAKFEERLTAVEERAARSTKTARQASSRARRVEEKCDSRAEVSGEFQRKVAELFSLVPQQVSSCVTTSH